VTGLLHSPPYRRFNWMPLYFEMGMNSESLAQQGFLDVTVQILPPSLCNLSHSFQQILRKKKSGGPKAAGG